MTVLTITTDLVNRLSRNIERKQGMCLNNLQILKMGLI